MMINEVLQEKLKLKREQKQKQMIKGFFLHLCNYLIDKKFHL